MEEPIIRGQGPTIKAGASVSGEASAGAQEPVIRSGNHDGPPPPPPTIPNPGQGGSEDGSKTDSTLTQAIARQTAAGGFEGTVTADYRKSHWSSVNAVDNAFEVLFLDYRQYRSITPEMVKRNHDAILQFWEEILESNSDVSRDRNRNKYGEATLAHVETTLSSAFAAISSPDGIEREYLKLDQRRLDLGRQRIDESIDVVIKSDELSEGNRVSIVAKGVSGGLQEGEAETYLYQRLALAGFQMRAEFNKTWMSEARYQFLSSRSQQAKPQTKVNSIVVYSGAELAKVLFDSPDWAKTNYLHNPAYLIADISKLYDSDAARKFEQLQTAEPKIDNRYIKVVYNLDPKLPYRLGGKTFMSIHELLFATASDYALFREAVANFGSGQLQSWLSVTDEVSDSLLYGSGSQMNDFLEFLYQINRSHPFYLQDESFETPGQLIERAKTSQQHRNRLSEAIVNGQVFKWLTALNRVDVIDRYNQDVAVYIDNPFYTDQERKKGAVQSLINAVDVTSPLPRLSSSARDVSLLSLDGKGIEHFKMVCTVPEGGFLKTKVSLTAQVEGVTFTPSTGVFDSDLGTPSSMEIQIQIDTSKLTKEEIYRTQLIIESRYEQISIPIAVKAVFPKTAYWLMVIKYAVAFAAVFGFIRAIVDEHAPFPTYFFAVLLLGVMFIFGWKAVKYFEKLR